MTRLLPFCFTSHCERLAPANQLRLLPAFAVISSLALGLSGCGVNNISTAPVAATAASPVSAQISGDVHGGQQPVSSATIQIYAASSAGDGAAALPLMSSPVLTNANGYFTFSSYTCPSASTPVYLTATGGNPGLSGTVNNKGIALMAALGPCGSLSSSTQVSVNELTTVGSLAALFPFANGYAAIGSQSSDAALFASAMTTVSSYTNVANGAAPGPGLATGYYASSHEIYALANTIAACVNTPGGVANDGSPCGSLFALATPAGGAAPTDTIGAILNILKNPSQNVTAIYNVAPPSSPFQPTLPAAPAKWVLPIISTSNPVIGVGVSGASTVNLGNQTQYSASVTGTTNQTVTWQVDGVTGGNSIYGTISPAGLYAPPAQVPTANALTISASSSASTTAAGSQPVSLLNPVPVISTASGSTTTYGQSFVVDVKGTGFVNGATLSINGSPVSTTAVTLADLQATVTNPTGIAMQITVAVANPSPGATQSTSSGVTLALPPATATAAARLLDQMSFGPTATTIAHVQQIGLLAALTEQFNASSTLFTLPPDPDTECSSNYHCSQSDWLLIAATANDQLRQRLSLLLSEMWVAPNQNDGAMVYYLNTMATDAFTTYRTIMTDLALAPQMGAYLNMVNSGAAPTGQIPNENFGREVMQLFTLGLNALNPDGTPQLDSGGNTIPEYTETQVSQFAKAFTGWTYANADGSTPAAFNGTANWNHAMVAVEARHDKTAKVLLNGGSLPASQTTAQDLKGALDNIFAQPNMAPFISKQLIQHLVSGNPSPAYVQRVATVFTSTSGDMQSVLKAVLLDAEARAEDTQTGDQLEANPTVQDGHLREPLLYVPNLMRGLNAVAINASDAFPYINLASNGLASLSEQPFSQSSVFNYYPPSYIIPSSSINAPEFALENTASVIPRQTLTDALIHSSSGYGVKVDISATGIFGSMASTPATLIDYLGMIFMHSQMPTDMRNLLITEITSIPSSNLPERVAVAVYLILTSSQYKILH